MAIPYGVIEIYTNEEARCAGRPLPEAILETIRDFKIAARCMVTRGSDACYENGEIANQKILAVSFNMPVKIEIVLPASDLDRLLPQVEAMVCEGVVAIRELRVVSHKTRRRLFPRQILVRHVMTASPVSVFGETSVDRAVTTLLSNTFTGLPVVDAEGRPVGVVSQSDLVYRAQMPIRLALMARSKPEFLERTLQNLSRITVAEIMTAPAETIQEDAPLVNAVGKMLEKDVKRLPVVDAWGKLTGMLSRLDVFQTIAREAPDWDAIRRREIRVADAKTVSDIMHRDTRTVTPDTSVAEVIRIIDGDDIQRVAVVDEAGRFLGMISDRNLLAAFSEHQPGIWEYLVRFVPFAEKRARHTDLSRELQGKTAGEVMKTELFTVREDTAIDAAIALMTAKGIKRLPVLAEDGRYAGMISRESLLRAGFAAGASASGDAGEVAQ